MPPSTSGQGCLTLRCGFGVSGACFWGNSGGMSGALRVAKPPSKPLLVFDGDCHFCGLWIRRWRQVTGDAVDYLPSQDPSVAERFPEIPRARFDTAVQLIGSDGGVLVRQRRRSFARWPIIRTGAGCWSATNRRRCLRGSRSGFTTLWRNTGRCSPCSRAGAGDSMWKRPPYFLHPLAFSAGAGNGVFLRVCVALDAGQRTHRTQWHFARRPVYVLGYNNNMIKTVSKGETLLFAADVVLVTMPRMVFSISSAPLSASSLHFAGHWTFSSAMSCPALAAVSLAFGHRRARLHGLPMGLSAARSGVSLHFPRAAADSFHGPRGKRHPRGSSSGCCGCSCSS